VFHWELEFPEVFFDADGGRLPHAGFDAVIGNPPWDMIRADAGNTDARARARDEIAPFLRFIRDAGIYTAQSTGHANRYQLFVERAIALTHSGGRFGLVLPSGLATDHGSAPLRRLLFSRCDVDAIVGMDKRPRRVSDSSQRPLSAGDRDARRADASNRVPAGSFRRDRARVDWRRDDRCDGVSGSRVAGAPGADLRTGPGAAEPARRARPSRSSNGRPRSFRRWVARPAGRRASAAS